MFPSPFWGGEKGEKMRDLQAYAAACMVELDSIGVPYCKNVSFSVNLTAKRRWGQCKHNKDGSHSINICFILLDESNSEDGLKNTIIHELLHTVPGGRGHKGEWRRWSEIVNRKLGYNITRVGSNQSKGVTSDPRKPKYVVYCPTCGKEWPRFRSSRLTENPELYRCACCNAPLARHQNI